MYNIANYSQILIMVFFILIFYFLIIRPQNKQKVAIQNMLNSLKTGDKIITSSGIIGKIFEIRENEIIIEVFDGTKIEILKQAIVSLINDDNK
ncbi:MAG: Preprotein translocase, YajC subunit [candidate division TM6 bacterium GW2011_GWF2_28_16]|nr:MAG: Preprotein translocase, YajC subunit [candidate division TM6 bacterium GW2011_GWF2_28_16]